MNKAIFLSLLFFLILSTNTIYAQQGGVPFKFKEDDYGYFTTKPIKRNFGKGIADVINDQKLIVTKKTDNIPGNVGVRFGVLLKLVGNEKDSIRLKVEWVYPHSVIDTISHNMLTSDVVNPVIVAGRTYFGATYLFENTAEIIKGSWQLNIYYSGIVIYSRRFMVY